jgi:hypothetical protein
MHQERDMIAGCGYRFSASVTSEAIETLGVGKYGEAGIMVIVKGTASDPVITVLVKIDILSNKLFKGNALF